MSGIAVDLGNELDAIRREAMLLTIALRLVATDVSGTSTPLGCDGYSPEAARLWLDAQGIASGIEKIYSGPAPMP